MMATILEEGVYLGSIARVNGGADEGVKTAITSPDSSLTK